MVELLIAMGVMFSALVVLAYTMFTGLSAVGFSRQSTEATALANQALEQIRALPANELYMSSSDLTGDNQLVSCGTGTCFNGRTVPVATYTSANAPLFPHVTHVTGQPGNTPYTIESYLTIDPSDSSGHTLVATVQVNWANSQLNGVANHVQVESKIYNNQFNEAPPGIHTFLASAQNTPGGITINGTILGQPLANVAFNFPGTQATMSGNSIGTTNVGVGAASSPDSGVVQSSLADSNITLGGTAILNSPAVSASAQSASGMPPATGGPSTSTPTLLTVPGSGVLDVADIQGTTSLGPTATASAVAASAANGAPGNPGQPAIPNNSLGYGQAQATQTGVVGANLNLLALLPGLPPAATLQLADLTPTGNNSGPGQGPDTSTVTQTGTAAAPSSQAFTATASSQFAQLSLLGLSVLGAPATPLVSLNSFDETASACAAPTGHTCTAAGPMESGTLSIYGAPVIVLSNLLNGIQSLGVLQQATSALDAIDLPLGVATVQVSGANISFTPSETGSANSGSETVSSGLTISLHVDVSILSLSLLSLNISVNLGSASATASYS